MISTFFGARKQHNTSTLVIDLAKPNSSTIVFRKETSFAKQLLSQRNFFHNAACFNAAVSPALEPIAPDSGGLGKDAPTPSQPFSSSHEPLRPTPSVAPDSTKTQISGHPQKPSQTNPGHAEISSGEDMAPSDVFHLRQPATKNHTPIKASTKAYLVSTHCFAALHGKGRAEESPQHSLLP